MTDVRLTGPGLLTGQPRGTVAVTVRLTDPAGTVLLAPGHRVDLLGGPAGETPAPSGAGTDSPLPPLGAPTAPAAARAQVLAAGALVLAVPATGAAASRTGGDPSGGLFPGMAAAADGGASGSGSGLPGIVVVAVAPDTAARLSAAAGSRPISVAVPN